jgi:hypothetical protein
MVNAAPGSLAPSAGVPDIHLSAPATAVRVFVPGRIDVAWGADLRVSSPAAGVAKPSRARTERSIGGDAALPLRAGRGDAGGVGSRRSAFHGLAALGLLCLSAFSATQAHAEVVVDGDRDQIQVSVDNDTVGNVLQALGQTGNLHYRTNLPLNKIIGGSFSGSLGHVVSRVLVGFDFVVHYNPQGVEILVYGESGATSVPPPQVEPYSPRPRPSRMTAQAAMAANLAPRFVAPHALSQYSAPPAPGNPTNP